MDSNSVVNLWLSYDEIGRAALRIQQEKALAAAERVDQFISECENQIGWTTHSEWRSLTADQQRYDFVRLLRQIPAITELTYLDSTGKEQLKVSRLEVDSVSSAKDFSTEPLFRKAITGKIWFGPVYFRQGSEPYMSISVAHTERNPGVTVAEVNLKFVWDVVTAIRVGEKGYAFVVNSDGHLIAHPDLSLVLRDTDLSHLPQVARTLHRPTEAASPLASSRRGTAEITTSLDGNSVLTAHAAIPRLGWIVFVQSPTSEVFSPVYTSLNQNLLLLGFGLFLATVAGTYLARRMVVPIRRLQQGAEQLGSGEFLQRISIQTGDEIEMLADQFNLMASRIQEYYETLEIKVEERTRDLNEALHQLQQEKEKAEVYYNWLRQLAKFLRHEVRQPVAQTNSSIELIMLGIDNHLNLKSHLTNAMIATKHVWNLIERASRATDAEAFVRESQPEKIDVYCLLNDILQGFTQTYSGVNFSLRGSTGIYVLADPILMKEAIGNLLNNAISFAEEETTVETFLQLKDYKAEIKVFNQGPFIECDPDVLFEPFTSSRSDPSGEHHGLGLYMVRLIAQQHGGTAMIANNPDRRGVEVSLLFPIASG